MSFHASQFGRSGHRDDRRRRLLAEEYSVGAGQFGRPQAAPIARIGQPSVHKSENYGDAEFMDEQLRLIDLIPRRLIAVILILLVGATAIAGLEALYAWMPELTAKTAGSRLLILDLAAPGSLGAWFSSLLLLAAGIVAVAVFSIRRHKTQDYHGHYRVWLWAATCWLLMATDVAASLHEAFQETMIAVTGTRLLGDGSIWWVIPAVFLLGAIGSRLLVDMWSCRLSSASLVLASICYLAALAMRFGWILPQGGDHRVLLGQGAQMSGHLLLLMAMMLHGRYVILDAEGLLPRRESKPQLAILEPTPEDQDASESEEANWEDSDTEALSSNDWVTVDPPHAQAQPVLKRVVLPVPAKAAPTQVSAAATPAPAAGSAADQKLSKSDRRALKKRLMEERLQREQKKAAGWGK